LNTTIKALQKELDALKNEIKTELKKGDCLVIDDKIVFSDGTAKLTISDNKTINTAAAWELINSTEHPENYINFGTRENLTIKH
jgi:hypothetical protein